MSNSHRFPIDSLQSLPNVTVPLSSVGVPSVYTTGPAAGSNVSFRMLPQQQCSSPSSFSHLRNQGQISFNPAVLHGLSGFQPLPSPTIGINPAMPNPAKMIEEQRKLQKERNFQLQQEKLKQFPVAGKKTNISADRLIDSMLGQLQKQKPSANSFPMGKILESKPSAFSPCNQWALSSRSQPTGPENISSACSKVNSVSSFKGFPWWCQTSHVPDLYRQIEATVTSKNLHAPDTNLLFPILLSSGLSQESLGHLWELVNQSATGQLTIQEMYAMLALIALVQSGYAVSSIDVLHHLPSCPVPFLNLAALVPSEQTKTLSSISAEFRSQNISHTVVRPSAISLVNTSLPVGDIKTIDQVTEDVSSWDPFADSSQNPDDDFGDFKSATPTAINYSLTTPTSPALEDDFDDFKQASFVPEPDKKPPPLIDPTVKITSKPTGNFPPSDLISPEDKYSVFRSLQQDDSSEEWGDFSFTAVADSASAVSTSKTLSAPEAQMNQTSTSLMPEIKVAESDEFGDFIHASETATQVAANSDFADFSNFKQPESTFDSSSQLDDDFGEFTSCMPMKTEFGQELMFHHLKDNVSLAESQSVSSLELGTFDGGHSGESKSSLSRQGSIPSLDLKIVSGIDGVDSEECSADLPLSTFASRNIKSPSPSSNTKSSDENESSVTSLPFQSSFSLIDKYSVIRQKKEKEEDSHVNCWIRCLERCNNILQNSKKIFNQMSCSSVCNEVLSSEEGGNYIRNVTEIYKVVCRIKLTSKIFGKQTQAITELLNEADTSWNTICGFFADTPFMPNDDALDFASCVLKPEPENYSKACGLCLLSIDSHLKSNKHEPCASLSYGGKNYHSPCANFWVNCVDPLLPALALPQLL